MKKILLLPLIIVILGSFYEINELNYKKHKEIKENLIQHPDSLPTKELALQTSFGFKNLRADLYWLETIQYIGGNALSSDYKEFLFIILDLITELNPYFEHPYIIGQLLLPSYNERYEELSEDEQQKYINQGITLGLKGVKNFCDPEKIKLIKGEDNLDKLREDAYKNPCKIYTLPYYLAYIYYFYNNDPETASLYYKIASANEEAIGGAKIMAAIMQGKGGNREKSFYMFLNIAKYVEIEDEVCSIFAGQLENIGSQVFTTQQIPLDGKLIKFIGETREQAFGKFLEEDEIVNLSDTKCSNYVNKAVRELNLAYIEKANEIFETDHEGRPALTAQGLFDDGYINFLPRDFQQYSDYGIIYKYNFDTDNYDYEMGTY
ncbi:hypothetical protein A9Q91_00390 [Candidatus Gracilibacteria bacterium 28_42_T64]|nr:hypothetical protein A9Q91_00390 [Candidatus Gracilibacteria bacterium 28_42_T64]